MQVQTLASVVPSPDGKRVAWTQSKAAMTGEQSEWVSQIYLAGADGAGRIQLTRHEKGARSPLFSPDGRFLYFSSSRSGKDNLWRIPADGGEAEMLTDWKGTLGRFAVSPCGKWVAFTGVEESADDEKAKKEKRDFRVVGEKPPNHALWIIPAEAGADGKRAPKKAAGGPYHIEGFDWSPDSRFLAFEHWPAPEADLWTKADISEVEIDSGKVRDRGRDSGGRIESRLLARRPLDRVSSPAACRHAGPAKRASRWSRAPAANGVCFPRPPTRSRGSWAGPPIPRPSCSTKRAAPGAASMP